MSPKAALPIFNPEIYTKIILNDLVIYAIFYLNKQGPEITSEDIVSACFVLFPKRFSMQKYPQYPDSSIVSRRWSDCKSKGYLKGNATKGFAITTRGIKRAERVEKVLGAPLKPVRMRKAKTIKEIAAPTQKIHPELKAYAKKFVRSIELSDAYKHYKKRSPINEFDFRSLLLCTMESPSATLLHNLNQFKEYVDVHNRSDLLIFLELCETKFSSLLGIVNNPTAKSAENAKKNL